MSWSRRSPLSWCGPCGQVVAGSTLLLEEGQGPTTGLDSPVGGDFRIGAMPASLAIGDFAKATHLTVKTLRHYHETGVLEPAEVDPQTGYRRYRTEQIATAQIIRRFRDLEMPLIEIQAVLSAPDVRTRNDLIAAHLDRLEGDLKRTQS